MMIPFPAALPQRTMVLVAAVHGRRVQLNVEGYLYEMGNPASR